MCVFFVRISTKKGRSLDETLGYLSKTVIEMDRPTIQNVAVVITNGLTSHKMK